VIQKEEKSVKKEKKKGKGRMSCFVPSEQICRNGRGEKGIASTNSSKLKRTRPEPIKSLHLPKTKRQGVVGGGGTATKVLQLIEKRKKEGVSKGGGKKSKEGDLRIKND